MYLSIRYEDTKRYSIDRTFFCSLSNKNLKWQQDCTPRRSLRGPARWVAEGPRRRRGVHRDGLEEAVISSSGRLTFFGTRSPGIAFRAAPSQHQSVTTPFSTVNERARHPDPNSLTDLADLGCDFACVHRELSRGSQRPFSSPSFWHYFHFLGTIFLACGAQCIIHAALHLGGVQWLQQPRCKRASRVCLHRAHRVARRYHAPWHLGERFRRNVSRHA